MDILIIEIPLEKDYFILATHKKSVEFFKFSQEKIFKSMPTGFTQREMLLWNENTICVSDDHGNINFFEIDTFNCIINLKDGFITPVFCLKTFSTKVQDDILVSCSSGVIKFWGQ